MSIYPKQPIITFFSVFVPPLFSLTALANGTESSLNSQEFDRLQSQQRQQITQFQQRQQARWLEQHQYQSSSQEKVAGGLSQDCLPYSALNVVGASLIDVRPLHPKAGECLNEVRLTELSRAITQAYLDKGYVHNPFQFEDDQSGTLTLRVTEGKIVLLTSNSKRLNFATLFPNAIGKPLNIKELDQVLDQANKMAGSQVSVDVLPAQNGEIQLDFVNQEQNRLTGFVGFDNNASQNYGRWQAKVGVTVDSPLGLSDTLYLGVAHSLKSARQDFTRSANLFYQIPYGYWSLSAFGAVSQFKLDFPLQYNKVEQKGRTWQAGIRADYTAHRGSNHIFNLYSQLEHTNSKSYFEDSLIQLQSPKLSTIQLGVNHLQLLENGSFVVDVNVERGLNWFNAIPNQGRDQPEGQFNKWNGELYWNGYHQFGQQFFHQSHRLSGQYSQNYLPSAKQADLLGRYSVRGFNDRYQSAEKSLVLQNQFGWQWSVGKVQIEPYLLLDLGVQKTSSATSRSEKALAYGVGTKVNWGDFQLNGEWATGRFYQPNQPIWQERTFYFNGLKRF